MRWADRIKMQRNMHRANKQADWELIDSSEHNIFQKVASKTKGVVTPANAISVAGLILTVQGARNIKKHNDKIAILQIGLGRALDVVDGIVANKTGTKSPLGEAVDATFDKLAVASCLPPLYKRQIISRRFAGALAVQNLTNSALTVIAKTRGQEIHPDKAGKDSAFQSWTAISSHYLANIAKENDCQAGEVVLRGVGSCLELASVVTGAEATTKYAISALGSSESSS